MAEEKDKELLEKDEVKFDDNYLSESYTKKFIKSGLLAIGASVLFRGKAPKDDLLRIGATTAATIALSDDKDYSKDAIVLASLFGVKNAVGLGKVLALSDIDNFKTVYKYAEKADEVTRKFNLASMNLATKTKETLTKNWNMYEFNNPKETQASALSSLTYITKRTVSSIYNTGKDSISYLYHNGIEKSLENISNNSVYNSYKENFQGSKLKELEILSNDIKEKFNLKIEEMDVGLLPSVADYFINVLTPDSLFTSKKESYEKAMNVFKQYKKFQRIEENTFFTDMLGIYSRLEDGKINVRMDKILEDRMHFGDALSNLARAFNQELERDYPTRAKRLSADVKESLFLEYLNRNGFGEVIDKAYNKNDLISFGEIQEMINNKANGVDKFIQTGKKTAFGFVKKIDENVIEVENLDILKNFAFTNVVRKGANGFVDTTSLNSHINLLQGLGALEKTFVGTFKIPVLDKAWNTWNPFKLIESDARIKNELVNKTLGFYYNEKGYLLNGMHIATETTKENKYIYRNGVKKLKGHSYITKFYSNERRDAQVVFNKNILGITNEEFKVSRDNAKDASITYTDIWNTFRNKEKGGFKKAVSQFTYSMMNPFSFRYNPDGKGFRQAFEIVDTSDGYFKEGTFFTQYIQKADIDVSAIRADNELLDAYMKEMKLGLATTVSELVNDEYRIKIANDLMNHINRTIADVGKVVMKELPVENRNIDIVNKSIMRFLLNDNKTFEEKQEMINNTLVSFVKKGKINARENNLLNKYYYNLAYANEVAKGNFTKILVNPFDSTVGDFFIHEIAREGSNVNKFIDIISESIGDEGLKNFFDTAKAAVQEYDKSVYNIEKHVIDLIHEGSISNKNFIDEYLDKSPLSDKNSIFNPIYEILKGKELNRISKKYLSEEFLSKAAQEEYIASVGKAPKYSNTTLGSLHEKYREFTGQNKKFLYMDSYKIFDEIENTIISHNNISPEDIYERIDKKTFDVLIDEFNKIKYKDTHDEKVSTIIRSTELNFNNMKNILDRVRESIYNLLTNKQLGNRELDSKMNILSKVAISQLQDALEYVGIERLTQDKLGNTGLKQIYNFMKYRYIPLFAMVGGAIAADTLSDALVPDDVPIVGNGISGVAVKGVAASRIGLQYVLQGTGMLSLMRKMENAVPGIFNNAIGDTFDILMSPSEMIDVYFRGKPIEVRDNRWWFTAGRQAGQGEEFRQYRPHLWYIWQNKDSGVYSNKFEKLFRRDFALTKYPWYLIDPYKEEREAYEKYGAVYPKTEQLFLEIPVIGQFLNATIGEVIKPTQYIGEEQWRVGEDMMLNPDYNPNDPSSPKYIKFSEPNKFVRSFFEAIEDLKTFAGIQGYGMTKITEMLFGATNPYQNEVGLASIDQDTGLYARYDRLQLGDLFGMTEPIRRLVDDSNSLGMIMMNPLEQKLPDWMPEYFKHGNNPYLSWDFGNYILEGREFDRSSNNNSGNEELNKFRMLALTAPTSDAFRQLQSSLSNQTDSFSDDEKRHYYESLSFAQNYGEREYLNKYYGKAPNIETLSLRVDRKISPYEFISGGKRYRFDSVTDDFNKMSERYGAKKATKMMNELNAMFQEGQTYDFKISQDASYSVGIDDQGDYFKIDSDSISDKYNLEHSSYRSEFSIFSPVKKVLFSPLLFGQNAPMNIAFEKLFGVKDVYNEWSAETVQSPFFRDWDSPVSSFLEPFYTFSSNNITSAYNFANYSNSIYLNSNASFNVIGILNKLGALKLPFNKITGNITKSSQYDDETKVHDELEKIKFLAGDKSFYNMTGKENIRQFSKMVNEQDAEFLEDLANVSNKEEREKILRSSNERLSTVLKTIWNRHQMAINNELAYEDVTIPTFDSAMNIGAYYGNAEEARNIIKSKLGISLSKLDAKRQGVFNAYRGTASEREAQFISNRMYRQYNSRPNIISTIYGHGVININQQTRGEEY